jgi:hypothetical protein
MGDVIQFPNTDRIAPYRRPCPGCGRIELLWEARGLAAQGVVDPVRCFDCIVDQVDPEDFLTGAVSAVPTEATRASIAAHKDNPFNDDGDAT